MLKGAAVVLAISALASSTSAETAASVGAKAFASGCLSDRGEAAWVEAGWDRLEDIPVYLTVRAETPVWRGAADDGYALAYDLKDLGCWVTLNGPSGDYLRRVQADAMAVGLMRDPMDDSWPGTVLFMSGLSRDSVKFYSLTGAVIDHSPEAAALVEPATIDPATAYAALMTLDAPKD